MGYLHITNLYKEQDILLFKECYALEKIHGSSAHIKWQDGELSFYAGGVKHTSFLTIFNQETLKEAFKALGHPNITVHGEVYGGKHQGMSSIYGAELKFIAFDVRVGDVWVTVPDMDQIAKGLGLEVVDWVKVPTDIDALNAERDKPSTQAIRNGCGEDKPREGVVLRPLIELTKNNGERIIAKHKQDNFSERATPQKIIDPATLVVLEEANAIANEWVTLNRLSHVLDKIKAPSIEHTGAVIKAMLEDVTREAAGEIVNSPQASRAIGSRTAKLFKQVLQARLAEES